MLFRQIGHVLKLGDVNPELSAALATGDYDFIDFGSSTGGSFNLARKWLGLEKGIGLDIDPAKVLAARAVGHEAYEQDVTALAPLANSVKVVIASHFLEHLPSRQLAEKALLSAASTARDYVFIRQPFFDANGPLMEAGFKLYSADWSGHTNLMTSYDMWLAARPLLERGSVTLALLGRNRIKDSQSPSIVPLDAPRNLSKRDLDQFSEKPYIKFEFPLYKELVAVIVKHDANGPRADWRDIAGRLGYDDILKVFPPESEPNPFHEQAKKMRDVELGKPKTKLAALPEEGAGTEPTSVSNVQDGKSPAERQFLFVCGVPRSGTTALAKLLNFHPEVAIGIERYKKIALSPAGITEFVPELFSVERFFDFREADTNVKADRDYAAMRAKYDSCLYVGDKVPRLYVVLPRLFKAFPSAKFIFITREIEAVAESWNKRADNPEDTNWPETNDFSRAVVEWNRANNIALRYAKEKADQFIVVSYEEIMRNNPSTVQALLGRLGLTGDERFWERYGRLMADAPARSSGQVASKPNQREFLLETADNVTYAQLRALTIGAL